MNPDTLTQKSRLSHGEIKLAMRIEKSDPRWLLAQEAAQDLRVTGLLPD
jgi:hypothetical protein